MAWAKGLSAFLFLFIFLPFAQKYLIASAAFIVEMIFSPLNYLGIFVGNQLAINGKRLFLDFCSFHV